jgi:hypothetical protein
MCSSPVIFAYPSCQFSLPPNLHHPKTLSRFTKPSKQSITGPWTRDEDNSLYNAVTLYGTGNWLQIAQCMDYFIYSFIHSFIH